MKILIGYDGSDYADEALAGLGRAGLPEKADAFVATIAEMWFRMPLSYGGVETSYVDETVTGEAQARETAAKGAERIKRDFPLWTIGHAAAAGSPAGILLAKADEWKPDLIVAGSQSRGGVGRFFFGSVAQSLAGSALCSVRIVRKREGSSGTNAKTDAARMIVGVDGSEGAEAALDSIISRNWAPGSEVRVVSAMDYLVPLKRFDLVEPAKSGFYREALEKAEGNAARAAEKLGQAGFAVSSVVKNRNPAVLLVEEAKEFNADCIFVGAKGMSRFERLLTGSVSAAVAARAECSVEVVRRQS